jgi:hypothetical protein
LYEGALELGEDTKHLEHGSPGGRRGVEALALKIEVTADGVQLVEEVVAGGVLRRRTHVKLSDKLAALTSLARHLGMFADRRLVAGGSLKQRIESMTPKERVAYVNELLRAGAAVARRGAQPKPHG